MRVVLQRVSGARVTIAGRVAGEIGPGLVVLVGFAAGDEGAAVAWMADKVVGLRVFPDEDGKMNRSLERDGRECTGGEPVHPVRRYQQGPAPELRRRRTSRPSRFPSTNSS